ncbi:6050_t:CDS:2 [Entrophospora sp. SA101]|nr:6050_t:CDS:2 [Entrophospora sp. SA101]
MGESTRRKAENVELKAEVTKLRHDFEELKQQTQMEDNASNSDVCQKLITQCSALPIHAESKSLEVKEINNFLDRKEKEKVSNIMRDINREKKLLRSNKDNASQDQESIQKGPFSSGNPTTEAQSTVSSEIKIPYNQKVEQGLMHELSEFIDEKSLSNSISDIISALSSGYGNKITKLGNKRLSRLRT